MKTMNCPYCNAKLKMDGYKEFENLTDHVCNPNAESHPLRPTWVCSNNCYLSTDCFWDRDGDIYVDDYMEWRNRVGNKKEHEAINSWAWEYRRGQIKPIG